MKTTTETITDKFARRRKKILKAFRFGKTVKMMRAVYFGWTNHVKDPTPKKLKKAARQTANDLFDEAIKSCLEANECREVGCGGFRVIAWPCGDLRLEFVPEYEDCCDCDEINCKD